MHYNINERRRMRTLFIVSCELYFIIGSDSCVFKCTNSNCLYDLTSLCDGEDDCGDFSDEILPCGE